MRIEIHLNFGRSIPPANRRVFSKRSSIFFSSSTKRIVLCPVGAFGRFEAGFSYLIRGRLFQRLNNRKIQPKGCARLRFALDVDKSVVIFHDSVDYRKPQAGRTQQTNASQSAASSQKKDIQLFYRAHSIQGTRGDSPVQQITWHLFPVQVFPTSEFQSFSRLSNNGSCSLD